MKIHIIKSSIIHFSLFWIFRPFYITISYILIGIIILTFSL